MDIATNTVQTIVNTGIAHGTQEARRDALARNTIPQINQNSQSSNNAAVASGSNSANPASSALYAQSEAIIRVAGEKNSPSKQSKAKEKDEIETKDGSKSKSKSVSASTSTTISGASLGKSVDKSARMNASASFMYTKGATYNISADSDRQKGDGYSSKAIADKYNSSIPTKNLGQSIDEYAT